MKRSKNNDKDQSPEKQARDYETAFAEDPPDRWWLERAKEAYQRGEVNRWNTKFAYPEHLWEAASEYFAWVEDNPLYSPHTFRVSNQIVTHDVAYDRPFTIDGLCIYLGISKSTLDEYRERGGEWQAVHEMIMQIVRTQKYEGAISGIFNPMLVARDLGLKDGSEVSGPNDGPIETRNKDSVQPQDLTTEEIETILSIGGKSNKEN